MRISDWSSDVCSSDLNRPQRGDDPLRDRAPQPIDHRDISPITDGCSMKILHVITGLNYGGAENMLAKLIETGTGTNARFRNVVLSMMTPGKIADRIQKCGVAVHSLGMRDRKSTRLNQVTNAHLVCRLLLEKK